MSCNTKLWVIPSKPFAVLTWQSLLLVNSCVMVLNRNEVLKAQSRLFTIVLTTDICTLILQPENSEKLKTGGQSLRRRSWKCLLVLFKNIPPCIKDWLLLLRVIEFDRLTKEVKELVQSGLCIDYSLDWKYWQKIFLEGVKGWISQSLQYLRNRKHFPCFYRVIETWFLTNQHAYFPWAIFYRCLEVRQGFSKQLEGKSRNSWGEFEKLGNSEGMGDWG